MISEMRFAAVAAVCVMAMTATFASETVEVVGERCTNWNAAYLPGCGGLAIPWPTGGLDHLKTTWY